jgi:catechol 2,3-dioxygenase
MRQQIHPAATTKDITLVVADLAAMVQFYQTIIGLKLRQHNGQEARLGAAEEDIVILHEQPQASRPGQATGLYHLAILLPSRPALANWLAHVVEQRYPLQGASDHLVSEAIYLADPEGNGLEIYCDRPREQWPTEGREVRMATDPLDFQGLLAERSTPGWSGVPAGTRLGHVHLHVNDLDQAHHFYVELLGLDLMQRYPGALFVSAGGYHHHLGLNTWGTAGAPPPPPNSLGLHHYSLVLPDEAERARLVERLRAANQNIEDTPTGPLLRDPAGNGLVLKVA